VFHSAFAFVGLRLVVACHGIFGSFQCGYWIFGFAFYDAGKLAEFVASVAVLFRDVNLLRQSWFSKNYFSMEGS